MQAGSGLSDRVRGFEDAMREQTIFLNRINVICPVQSLPQKHSASRSTQITLIFPAVSSLNEGRIAIVTNVGMGCGGRGSVGRVT
jgi:hypothetical protein